MSPVNNPPSGRRNFSVSHIDALETKVGEAQRIYSTAAPTPSISVRVGTHQYLDKNAKSRRARMGECDGGASSIGPVNW